VTKTNFLRIKIDEPIIVLPINYYFAHCWRLKLQRERASIGRDGGCYGWELEALILSLPPLALLQALPWPLALPLLWCCPSSTSERFLTTSLSLCNLREGCPLVREEASIRGIIACASLWASSSIWWIFSSLSSICFCVRRKVKVGFNPCLSLRGEGGKEALD
jgi:hypothetical protein